MLQFSLTSSYDHETPPCVSNDFTHKGVIIMSFGTTKQSSFECGTSTLPSAAARLCHTSPTQQPFLRVPSSIDKRCHPRTSRAWRVELCNPGRRLFPPRDEREASRQRRAFRRGNGRFPPDDMCSCPPFGLSVRMEGDAFLGMDQLPFFYR